MWDSPHLPSCSLHLVDTHRRRPTHTHTHVWRICAVWLWHSSICWWESCTEMKSSVIWGSGAVFTHSNTDTHLTLLYTQICTSASHRVFGFVWPGLCGWWMCPSEPAWGSWEKNVLAELIPDVRRKNCLGQHALMQNGNLRILYGLGQTFALFFLVQLSEIVGCVGIILLAKSKGINVAFGFTNNKRTVIILFCKQNIGFWIHTTYVCKMFARCDCNDRDIFFTFIQFRCWFQEYYCSMKNRCLILDFL